MEIRTVKVYKFDELEPSVQNKILNDMCYINVDHDWYDCTYEDAKNIGLKITGFDTGRGNYITGELNISANEVCANIFRDHGDICDTYKTAEEFMKEWEPIFSDYMDEKSPNYESMESEQKLMDLEEQFLHDIMEEYLVMLRNEYEYQTSEESIKETIECNEYEFTNDGNIF